jgi:hypothetical protein
MVILTLVKASLRVPGPIEPLGLLGGLTLSVGVLPSDLGLLDPLDQDFPGLGVATHALVAERLRTAVAHRPLLSFLLALPDNFVFYR